jgi:hypothetical protein
MSVLTNQNKRAWITCNHWTEKKKKKNTLTVSDNVLSTNQTENDRPKCKVSSKRSVKELTKKVQSIIHVER